MRTARVVPLLVALAGILTTAGPANGQASFKLPYIRDGVLLSDNKTFVVSIPSTATLVYFDTMADKELKRVELDFKPTYMAVQGQKLFVATEGASKVHVLEAATAKEIKEIKVPGEPVQALGCHPAKGLLYAVNIQNEVYAIDAAAGTAEKTGAVGQYVAVPANDDKTVYFGIQKPIQNVLLVEQGPGKTAKVSLGAANIRAVMLKYTADGNKLKLVGAQDNAAINGRGLAVSPDGKQVALAGAGGWRSKTEMKGLGGVAVWDTSDMETRLGQVESVGGPQGVAFHPVLPLGAVLGVDSAKGKATLFSTKSFVTKETIDLLDGSHPNVLLFGANGTKLIFGSIPGAGGPKESTIQFVPLKLSDADKEALKKAYPK